MNGFRASVPTRTSVRALYGLVLMLASVGAMGRAQAAPPPCTPPGVLSGPVSGGPFCNSDLRTLTVQATGDGLLYQWQEFDGASWSALSDGTAADGTVIAGALTMTLSLTNVAGPRSGRQYECVVSGTCGTPVTSAPATMLWYPPLVAATVSGDGEVLCTTPATISPMTVSPTGGHAPFAVQWQFSHSPDCGSASWTTVTASPTTMTSTQVAPIPDFPGPAESTSIVFPDHGLITYMMVTIDNITHPFDSDLTIWLRGPNGRKVTLSHGRGADLDNFIGTRLSDTASTRMITGIAPFTGSYRPDSSTFGVSYGGTSSAGSWWLVVLDGAAPDIGTVHGWSITIIGTGTGGTPTTYAPSAGAYTSETRFRAIVTDSCNTTVTSNCVVKHITSGALLMGAPTGDGQQVCAPADFGAMSVVASGGATPFHFTWQLTRDADCANGVYVDLPNSDAPSYDPPPGATAGAYRYRCRVTDTCGNVATSPCALKTSEPAPILVSQSGDGVDVCPSGSHATLTATFDDGGATVTWMPGSVTGPSLDVSAPGTYTATAQSAFGCTSAPTVFIVTSCLDFATGYPTPFTFNAAITARGASAQTVAPDDTIILHNVGTAPLDYGAYLISPSGYRVADPTGANSYTVQSIFNDASTEPALNAFVAADDLVPEGATTSASRFADGALVYGGGGFNVLPATDEHLWLLVTGPTYFSTPTFTTHMVVTARQHLP